MKQLISELEILTSEFLLHIDEVSYEEVESFVEKRQRHVDSILVEVVQHRMDSEDEQRLKVLLSKDEIIVNKMIDLKKEAQDWLQQRNRIKAQRNAYENPYSADSLLLDRRK
ncbi:hypothetical protein PUW24_04905 [Paenibacillus urinalis]|uniref:Flagellar protein FliT n=1 Tax=Paenibacillus urinalis TaxID=521520 RepID=A0ABY7X8H5_9BACL|nr:hypothetical protein [Paenibacillus urinalis]WDH98280.1 hypothetical protein PUW24_04905 [Paenibacillus urinalis]WDI01966.1 hypothetical protein PUW25_22640 [Paenibacillus urinalis]